MKRVTFSGKRAGGNLEAHADNWVLDRAEQPREPTKRFTIDVPASLHRRVKTECATNNLVMADVVRDLLERRFPLKETSQQGVLS